MVIWFTRSSRNAGEDGLVGIKHRMSQVVRAPAFGIAVLTPVVLAGAVAAAPGHIGASATGEVAPVAAA